MLPLYCPSTAVKFEFVEFLHCELPLSAFHLVMNAPLLKIWRKCTLSENLTRNPIRIRTDVKCAAVNISSYPVMRMTGLFIFSRAEIFKLGCFVQKYSDFGISCRNICQVPFCVTQSEKCILEKVTQMVH